MVLKKVIIFFILFILFIGIFYNVCFATEMQDKYLTVVLNDFNGETKTDQNSNNQVQIYSESAILMEQTTGKILYEKDIYARKYPASTTKILTGIIALERCKLDEKAVASDVAINTIKSGYSTANIQVGETFTLEQLLDVMLIHSANEAANIIAEHISGSIIEFSKLMNSKAKEIGCLDSNFVNPNGMHDENHYSTAYDLAIITRYCMKNEKFRQIVTKMECSLPQTELWQEPRIYKNTNSLLILDNKYYYPYCIGGKTGFTTPAKNCLTSSSNKDGFETISVVLHAEATEDGLSARYTDTIKLFEYGYNNYNINDILEEYDLIEYKNDVKAENKIIGIFTNELNDYKEEECTSYNNWIKIIIGGAIILVIICISLIKWSFKLKKNKILFLKQYNK